MSMFQEIELFSNFKTEYSKDLKLAAKQKITKSIIDAIFEITGSTKYWVIFCHYGLRYE